jgi:mannose/fructose/N-acetylgalactosamine-specific phosphotransferase system component IIC
MIILKANTPLPKLLGYAGAIPLIGLALLAHMLANQQDVMRHALLGYGACIVSFVGAVHWGICSQQMASARLAYSRHSARNASLYCFRER